MADEVKSVVPNKAGYPEFPASPAVDKRTGVALDPGTPVGRPVNANPGAIVETVAPHPDDVANNPHPSTIVPIKVVEPLVETVAETDNARVRETKHPLAEEKEDTVKMGSDDPMTPKSSDKKTSK